VTQFAVQLAHCTAQPATPKMTEVETVISFLERSSKGRLEYDRDWADSKEGVDRVLSQLSDKLDGIQIEGSPVLETGAANESYETPKQTRYEEARSHSNGTQPTQSFRPTDKAKNLHDSLRRKGSLGSPLERSSLGSVTPGTMSPLRNNKFQETTSDVMSPSQKSRLQCSTPDAMSPSQKSRLQCSTPDAMSPSQKLRLHGSTPDAMSPLQKSRVQDSTPNKLSPLQRSLLNTSTPNSSLHTPPSGKFFGLRPVLVNVNRSTERNIDNKQFVYSSSTNSPNTSFTEIRKSDSSVFIYDKGFLNKVSQTSVSVDLVNLKLEAVKGWLGLDEDGEDEEESDDSEYSNETDEDLPDPESLEIDRKLINLRENMKAEAERKNAEIIKKFKDKSEELAEVAEKAYKADVEEFQKQMKDEEQRILDERKKCREEAEQREAADLAADRREREDVEEVLRICREQESKIKEEVAREHRIKEQVDRFESLLPGLKNSIVNLLDIWGSVQDKSKLSEESKGCVSLENEFCNLVDDLKRKAKNGDAEESDWTDLYALENSIKSSVGVLEKDIQNIEQAALSALKAAEEAEAAAQHEAALAAEEAAKAAAAPPPQPLEPKQPEASQSQEAQVVSHNQPSNLVTPVAFYHEIMEFKTKFVQDIAFPDHEKKIKTDLTLAISTSLNAISSQSETHLNDKLSKLALLLAGQPITIKDTQICAGQHRFGIKFCKALLAKKIVRQGEEVISSNAETAFPFASVALALWDMFPDFGKLLLAYFFEFCPYLAPFYPERTTGQSDKDYYQAMGYKYEKEAIEKQDKYLKRMTGLSRLFAAIATSSKAPGSSGLHPFGPKMIWQFIANLVNIEPKPDITATILLVVLEVSGHLMLAKYGAQFFKLLLGIKQTFLPRLEAVKTDGGPTVRLDNFLSNAVSHKQIPSPTGILASGFIKKINL